MTMDTEGVIRLRRTIVGLARQFNACSSSEDLTPSQSSVLSLVVTQGPLSLSDLVVIAGLNPTMLSRTVSRLHAMNLVSRSPGPADQRTASVTATATGAQVHQHIQEQQAAVVSRCLEHLGGSREMVLLDALPFAGGTSRHAATTR
jgi:DNA-binding MarR family transcriptional regulator